MMKIKVGDCYNWREPNGFSIIITKVELVIYYIFLADSSRCDHEITEERLNELYVYNEKLTKQEIIRNIIE